MIQSISPNKDFNVKNLKKKKKVSVFEKLYNYVFNYFPTPTPTYYLGKFQISYS